jgi:hypothetical protein
MQRAAELVASCRALIRFIEARRWPLSDEKRLQETLSNELLAGGFVFEREALLVGVGIIDFMVMDVGVEVKIKGAKREIYRQCERYCGHERVHGLVLVSNVAMGMPAEINGKPIFIASLGKGWL